MQPTALAGRLPHGTSPRGKANHPCLPHPSSSSKRLKHFCGQSLNATLGDDFAIAPKCRAWTRRRISPDKPPVRPMPGHQKLGMCPGESGSHTALAVVCWSWKSNQATLSLPGLGKSRKNNLFERCFGGTPVLGTSVHIVHTRDG